MSNYAWANPQTGIREQASSLEDAVRRVWLELQTQVEICQSDANVYEQEPAGQVEKRTAVHNTMGPWEGGYAWASPAGALRLSAPNWENAVQRIQSALDSMTDAPDAVIVYRQRVAITVYQDDPEPPAPSAVPMELDTPTSLIAGILGCSRSDYDVMTTLAMLWIAESLQKLISGDEEALRTALQALPALPEESEGSESPEDRRARLVRERQKA